MKTRSLSSFLLLLMTLSFSTIASDVYVETEHQKGQGMLRAMGGKCFLYTPAHVVAKSNDIFINTRFEKDIWGELITTYPQDLALVKLADTTSSACSESSWKDGGSRANAVLDVISSGQLNYRHKNGRVEVFEIEITNKAIHSTFDIRMSRNDKQFRRGMSGSIITVGDYPIGMLLSVDGAQATALRMDTMSDLTRTVIMNYATEKEKIEQGFYSQESAKSVRSVASETPSPSSLSPPATSPRNAKEQIFKGRLSEGAEDQHTILARGNTAYRLTNVSQHDNLSIDLYLIDSAGNTVSYERNWKTRSDKESWGFGVSQAGEYTLKVAGRNGSGNYQLKLEVLATPEELISESNVLGHGDVAKGQMASGTFAEYKILARGNTAYRLSNIIQVDWTSLDIYLLDSAGNTVSYERNWKTNSEKEVWGFGVSQAGEYTLKVAGRSGSGNYQLKLDILASPQELISKSNVLGHGDIAKGQIAPGTFAEYKILARGNTAYRLHNLPEPDRVSLDLYLLDSAGNTVNYERNWKTNSSDEMWGFGVSHADEYILKVAGRNGSGSYRVKLEVIATPEELISESHVLGHNDIAKGQISEGTFAEYKILAKGNSSYHLSNLPQIDWTSLDLYLIDSAGNTVNYERNWKTNSRRENWGFGVSQPGEYTLKVSGRSGSGAYALKLQQL